MIVANRAEQLKSYDGLSGNMVLRMWSEFTPLELFVDNMTFFNSFEFVPGKWNPGVNMILLNAKKIHLNNYEYRKLNPNKKLKSFFSLEYTLDLPFEFLFINSRN
jgi:hypothetical protein